MLLHYDWAGERGPAPLVGTEVLVSGDPDRAVLNGQVWRSNPEPNSDGSITLSIMLEDGQNGAEEFQEWVLINGDVGVELPKDQTPVP